MKTCPFCKGDNQFWALSCSHCTQPLELFPYQEEDPMRPQSAIGIAAEFAIAAGLLLLLGPFLPFAESGEHAKASLANLGAGAIVLLCAGGIAACFGVLSIFLRRRFVDWYLICAGLGIGITVYFHVVVRDQLASLHQAEGGLGLGIYFGYLGGFFALVAAAVCLIRKPSVVRRVQLEGMAESLTETAMRMRPSFLAQHAQESRSRTAKRRRR